MRLVGVGASDCTDLVAMRRSMYVVQELMGGGDMKALLLRHMSDPWAGVYSKVDALRWAMQVGVVMGCFSWKGGGGGRHLGQVVGGVVKTAPCCGQKGGWGRGLDCGILVEMCWG